MPHVPVFEKVVWMKMHTYFTDLEVFVSPCLFDMIYPIIQVSMMARLQLNWLPSTTRKIPCWSTSGVTKGSGFPSRCLVSNAGSSLRILKYLIFIHPRCPMGLEYLPTWKAKIYGKCIGKYACPMEHLGTVIPKERGIELPPRFLYKCTFWASHIQLYDTIWIQQKLTVVFSFSWNMKL